MCLECHLCAVLSQFAVVVLHVMGYPPFVLGFVASVITKVYYANNKIHNAKQTEFLPTPDIPILMNRCVRECKK